MTPKLWKRWDRGADWPLFLAATWEPQPKFSFIIVQFEKIGWHPVFDVYEEADERQRKTLPRCFSGLSVTDGIVFSQLQADGLWPYLSSGPIIKNVRLKLMRAFQALEDPHSFAYFWYFLNKCVMLLGFVGTCRHYILQPVFICAWSNHRKLTTSTLLMMCDLSLVLSLPEQQIHFPSWLYSSGHPGYCHFFSLRRAVLHQPYVLPETKLLFVWSNIKAYIYHRHWHFFPRHYSHHVGKRWSSKNIHYKKESYHFSICYIQCSMAFTFNPNLNLFKG